MLWVWKSNEPNYTLRIVLCPELRLTDKGLGFLGDR